jgi:nucleotide-binding universal stress UspA family protein
MATINHVLFPFDFSEQGSQAVPFIRAVAACHQARVSVLTVIPPAWNTPPGGRLPVAGLEAPEPELQARQDQVLAKQFAGLTACRQTLLGDPALKILEFARTRKVDLIMMPTRGVIGDRDMLLGSVTVKVLHDAKCPVWTAAHAGEQKSPPIPRTILCAVDGTPHSGKLMRWASDFSERMSAKLSFLHVVLPADGGEIQEEVNKAAFDRLEELKKSAWIQAPLRVITGEITGTVLDQARQDGADLLVIGRGLLASPSRRLLSHAYAIIQRSPCPVVSV